MFLMFQIIQISFSDRFFYFSMRSAMTHIFNIKNQPVSDRTQCQTIILFPNLAIYPIAQENDTLKAQVKADKEKIVNLEKENKALEKEVDRLLNDLDVILSKKLIPESDIEESKIGEKKPHKKFLEY